MRKGVVAGILFVVVAFTVACSGNIGFTPPPASSGGITVGNNTPREALLDKDLGVIEEIIATLKTMKDQTSVNNARPKLNDLLKKHADIQQEAQKMGLPTPAETDGMKRKFEARAKKDHTDLNAEMVRVLQLGGPAGEVYRQMVGLNQEF